MNTVLDKVSWRLKAVAWAFRFANRVDWTGLFREIASRHSDNCVSCFGPLEEDSSLGLYQVGPYRVWFPLRFGLPMLNAVADETLTRRIYHDSRQHFEDGGWAMDAGACEGLLALEILRQGGKVVAVEPVSDLAHALERTLDPYIREGRALVVACALSDYNGEAPFQVMPDYVIGSGFSVSGEKEQRAGSGSYAVTVPVRTIDDLVSELGLARVSFIKADIEGAEVAMLRGAVHTLRTHRPQLAICAYHAPSDRLVIPQMLETFGYDWRFNAAIEVVLAWFGSP